jgi:hypothetical protein
MFRSRSSGGSGSAANRRRSERLSAIPLKSRGAVEGRIYDISRTGVSVETQSPLDAGAVIELELVDLATGMACPFQARVVWSREGRVGLEFTQMTAEQDGWLAARFVEWLTQAAGL